MASTICRRCKRPLKDPASIEREMGPTCAAKAGGQTSIIEPDKDYKLIPFDGDVVCRREGATKYMNIPQTLVYHSPTGLEWGYAGSGPADFALNVLFYFTNDKEFSMNHHQDFKFKFIAALPREGGTIRGEEIKQWIEGRKAGKTRTDDIVEDWQKDPPTKDNSYVHARFVNDGAIDGNEV